MNKVYAVPIDPTIFSPAGTFPTIASFINVLIPNLMIVAGVIFIIMIMVTGFRFISKAGSSEPTELKKIQDNLAAAVVGLILIVAAYWIILIIETVTGVKIISPTL